MAVAVGVAFKRVAKSYWFDPGAHMLRDMDRVVVETARGLELGTVRVPPREVPVDELQAPLKPVVRLATDEDARIELNNRALAKQALQICAQRVGKLELPMKLIQAEYSFDAGQVTIYFAAETRIDFRELVRELAAVLRTRVQLHQVGARDHAKLIGGVGPCGLTLCCSTFLTEFAPISMKMAKDQSLFLNPVKFSGVCGKLMCCLSYEHQNYVETKQRLPSIGDLVMTPKGQGRVIDLNIIKEEALVQLSEPMAQMSFPAAELKRERTERCPNCSGCEVNSLEADLKDAALSDGTPEDLEYSED